MTCVCVGCGTEVKDKEGKPVVKLYDQTLLANTNILKLLECHKCGQVCDRYLEVCGTLVLLDLALQSQPAFRHVLINCGHAGTVLRLGLVTTIVDGYCRWFSSNSGGKFFEQEFEFYSCCGEALTSLAIFLLTSLIAVLGSTRRSSSSSSSCQSFFSSSSLPTLLTGLLLAYCTSFLKLVALLWSTPDTTFLWSFVDLLFLLTSVSVLRVLTRLSTPACWATALSSHLAMHSHTTISYFLTSTWG